MGEPQSFITGDGDQRQTLVVVFLRGGADGLNIVAPLQDDGYYNARPRIAINKSRAVALDGFYGLNPLLRDLEPAYKDGALAIIHAAGSEDTTRSHFEAQDLMEHGGITGGGWLGRFLRTATDADSGPLSAVALGKAVPECLRGAPAATVFQSLEEFSPGMDPSRFLPALSDLYGREQDELGLAGRHTVEAARRLDRLRGEKYQPANGAASDADGFSRGLLQIAQLIKGRVGLRAAALD